MKKRLFPEYGTAVNKMLQLVALAFLVFYLSGCSCYRYCNAWKSFSLGRQVTVGSSKDKVVLNGADKDKGCEICGENELIFNSSQNSTSMAPPADTGTVVNNNIPRKNGPQQVGSPPSSGSLFPGEYYSTTFFAGPAVSFKSSDETYSYENSKHDPGIGLQLGMGVAFPLSKDWGVASSIRYKQMTASETLSYNMTGPGTPGETSEYKDTYKYNYAGATIMAEYRPAKHLAIVAGPELNYLLSANMKAGGSSGNGEKTDLAKDSKKMGLDILAGLKYEIPAGNKRSKWGLSLIYDHRLSRLNKTKVDGYEVPAYKMKGVQLGISYYMCRCGKKPK